VCVFIGAGGSDHHVFDSIDVCPMPRRHRPDGRVYLHWRIGGSGHHAFDSIDVCPAAFTLAEAFLRQSHRECGRDGDNGSPPVAPSRTAG
jgi:hypothetical protein